MLSRADVISLAASVGGILLALQSGGYDSFDINKSWQVNLQSPFQNSLAGSLDRCRRDLAAPIVVDLTGDGHNDVVLSTCEPSIKLISSTSSQDQPFGPEVSYSYKLDSASTDLTPHAIALGTLFGGGDDSSNACESHSLEKRLLVLLSNLSLLVLDRKLEKVANVSLPWAGRSFASHAFVRSYHGDTGEVVLAGASFHLEDEGSGEDSAKVENVVACIDIAAGEVLWSQREIVPLGSEQESFSIREFTSTISGLQISREMFVGPDDERWTLVSPEEEPSLDRVWRFEKTLWEWLTEEQEPPAQRHAAVAIKLPSGIKLVKVSDGRVLADLGIPFGTVIHRGKSQDDLLVVAVREAFLTPDLRSVQGANGVESQVTSSDKIGWIEGCPAVSVSTPQHGAMQGSGSSSLIGKPLLLPSGQSLQADIVLLCSTGIIASYKPDGTLQWLVKANIPWEQCDKSRNDADCSWHRIPSSHLFRPMVDGSSRDTATHLVLAVGYHRMMLIQRGSILSTISWTNDVFPVHAPVIADFDNDGVNDVILVMQQSIVGFNVVRRSHVGMIFIFMACLATASVGTVIYRVNGFSPDSSQTKHDKMH